MRVLGIESSCDETAAAVVVDGVTIRSNVVRSQEALHAPFSGVVPEIACRAHVESIVPVVRTALDKAGIELADVDAIAVANRPGLVGALLVGVSAAKSLALALDRPLIGVNHVEAHLYAVRMEYPEFRDVPFVGLVASGGHTSLYFSSSPTKCELMGSTQDDAVGEAFDKVAKVLDLGYPGGPIVDRLAREGNTRAYRFPRTLLGDDSLDFSFSGIKTAVLYACRGKNAHPTQTPLLPDLHLPDVAASFQEAIVEVLLEKIRRAVARTGVSRVAVGGGVACNGRLRDRLQDGVDGAEVRYPSPALCSDNAAMIAGLGYELLNAGVESGLDLDAYPTVRG